MRPLVCVSGKRNWSSHKMLELFIVKAGNYGPSSAGTHKKGEIIELLVAVYDYLLTILKLVLIRCLIDC